METISFPKFDWSCNPSSRFLTGPYSSSVDTSTVFTPLPGGRFNIEQHKAEESAARALRKHELEAAAAKHRQDEETKRNNQRLFHERVMFLTIVTVLGASLVISMAVALLADNDNRQDWAQSIVVLIIGGIVGGMAGYITGQSST